MIAGGTGAAGRGQGKRSTIRNIALSLLAVLALLAMLDVFPFRVSFRVDRTLPAMVWDSSGATSGTTAVVALQGTITLRAFRPNHFTGSMWVEGIGGERMESAIYTVFTRNAYSRLPYAPIPGGTVEPGPVNTLQGYVFSNARMTKLLLLPANEGTPRVVAAPAASLMEAEALIAKYSNFLEAPIPVTMERARGTDE